MNCKLIMSQVENNVENYIMIHYVYANMKRGAAHQRRDLKFNPLVD